MWNQHGKVGECERVPEQLRIIVLEVEADRAEFVGADGTRKDRHSQDGGDEERGNRKSAAGMEENRDHQHRENDSDAEQPKHADAPEEAAVLPPLVAQVDVTR